MYSPLLCLAIVLGFASSALASETSAEPLREAQIVIVCPGLGGRSNKVGIALVSGDQVRTTTVISSNGKGTLNVPAGHHELVLYNLDPLFGPSVEHYLDAEVAEGQVYFAVIQPNHERIIGEALAGLTYAAASAAMRSPRFWLYPFKRDIDGTNGFLLDSPALERWMIRCVSSRAEQREPDETLRSHITDRLEKLRKRYGRAGERKHAWFFDAEDGLAVGTSLSDRAIARALASSRSIVDEPPGTLLFEIPVPSGLDEASVQKALVYAARARRYDVAGVGPDRLAVQLINKGTDATYTLVYDESRITVFERAFKRGHPEKPVNMRRWGENLRVYIETYLRYALNNRTVPDEVIDMDPEHLTDGPTAGLASTVPIPAGLTPGEVQQALVDAGLARGFTVVARMQNQVALRLVHRGKFVTIRITYDDRVAQIYADARKESAAGAPVKVDGWVDNLSKVAQIMLERRTL